MDPRILPSLPLLRDRYGRSVTDIRVSLTDRCNFSCLYCHNEGLGETRPPRGPTGEEMTASEVLRLLRIAREFGIVRVKLTGGEPLLRSDVEEIVEGASREMEVSLTTNGSLLAGRAESLKRAGLSRINVSLDTLDEPSFRRIRGGSLRRVLEGIEEALGVGLVPLKLNVVLTPQTLEELPRLWEFARSKKGVSLQLIELMPEIRSDVAHLRVDPRPVEEFLRSQSERIEVRPLHHRRIYFIRGVAVEFVLSVGNPEFCAHCTRIRVTHRGELKGCLNRLDDLVPTRGLDDEGVRRAFLRVVDERMPYYGVYDRIVGSKGDFLPAESASKLYPSLRRPLLVPRGSMAGKQTLRGSIPPRSLEECKEEATAQGP